MALKDKRYVALFLAPALLLVALFLYYPLGRNFYYSFTQFDGYTKAKFIGWDNYTRLLSDPVIGKALINTFILLVFAVLFQVGLAVILAVMLDSVRRGYKFFRTVFFFPVVISGTAIGLMFSLIYGYDFGMLNSFLIQMGLGKQVWLTETRALALVLIPTIWQYVGLYFVVMLTAISKIPEEIYESAQLEGITGVKKTVYIVIPLIWDVIATSVLLIITGVLKTFDTIWVITKGGPMNSTELLSTYMYRKTFTDQVFSYGATISVLIILLGVLLSVTANRILKRETVTF